MLKKLRNKILWVTMCLVLAMLVILFSLVYYFTKVNLQDQSVDAARAAAQSFFQPGWSENRSEEGFPTFTISFGPFGNITVYGSSYHDLTDEAFLMELLDAVKETRSKSGMLKAYDLCFYAEPDRVAFVDISSQRQTLQGLVKTSLFTGILGLILAYFLARLLAWWAVKPVEQAWKQQKQFVSDASHELKTPLTVIISNAELLQTQEDPEKYSRNILTASKQMRTLVDGLLELARADNGQVKKHFAPLDLSKLVQDICLSFEAVFFERGLFLDVQIQPQILVVGNAQYLYQVVDILLDNACKYAQPGQVRVCLEKQGNNGCLCVHTPGEPIAREELERIFHRFYRMDKSRTGAGGFGLGLSIAKSVVEEHGGKIWAQSREDGNGFYVQLPLLKEKNIHF